MGAINKIIDFIFKKGILIDIVNQSLKVCVFVIFLYIVISYIRAIRIEKKINKYYSQMNDEINQQNTGGLISVIEGRKEMIRKKYEVNIREAERKRRFIIEKIPFFK